MSKNDGGPAFPQGGTASPSGDVFVSAECGGAGMSLRDWFAGMALQGLLSNLTASKDITPLGHRSRAEFSYGQADAMIAAREQE